MVSAVPHLVRHALHVVARHTGIPVLFVAALAVVLSWRIVRRTWRLALEIAVVSALLVALTELHVLGW